GAIYLIGTASSIMRLDGLEGIRRLPEQSLVVTEAMLRDAQEYFVRAEAQRQQKAQQGPLIVAIRAAAPMVDGKLDEWSASDFVPVDKRAAAAVAVAGDRLYAAFKTDDPNLLANKPEALPNLFKTGGALDLMLGNVQGGQRLLVTKVQGKTTAVLYRPRDPNRAGDPVKFISNIGINKTIVMDRVENVSEQVTLAGDAGNYEISVPLALLNLQPEAGQSIKGDIGILRGNGFQTLQRVYWHNKATGLVSDLASEAELTPQLWGTVQFE
ncbi:MAG: hypothetical protein M3347_12340, partial [Armatimonadota bacterium]|nr:hypothetical protein [Armatimonadota bacterium]